MWTDERLDDRFGRIDERFDQLDLRLRGLEAEMRTGMREIRGAIDGLRRDMLHGVIALSVGYAGLIAAVVARGL